MLFNLFISSPSILDFIILLSLDNDVLETPKRRAKFYNSLSQIFIVKYKRTWIHKFLPRLDLQLHVPCPSQLTCMFQLAL